MLLLVGLLLPSALCAGKSKRSLKHFLNWMAGRNHGHVLKEEKLQQLMREYQAVNGDSQMSMEDLFNQLMNSGFTEDDLEDTNGDNTFLQFLRWVATGHKTKKTDKKQGNKPALVSHQAPAKNTTKGSAKKGKSVKPSAAPTSTTTKSTKTVTTVPPKYKKLHRRHHHRHHHRHHRY